ncbi:MAG: GNAT family N-acetyltransferase [Burkholderiaceae bacterium]|nr:GNAT family N-acetyltransferase [Burkholderiaceae bacterium]MCD6672712.1 GNAT family N-acetyltransferase [Burkholderiaceae bacterium]
MQASYSLRADIRPLAPSDLEEVVAIDAAVEGHSRRPYFERRLQSARREPGLHAQFAAIDASGLAGCILARVLEGEFGRSEPSLRLEAIGVRGDVQGQGIGRDLFAALSEWAKRHGIARLRTQARWNDLPMLRWMSAMGFERAPEFVLDCAVSGGAYTPERDDPVLADAAASPPAEVNFGGQASNDFERLARDTADVRAMNAGELRDIVRIDRAITGRNREEYMAHRFAETTADSAIGVSLSARIDDDLVIGFLMARVDLGDYGRTESVAVLDTIGVDPAYAGRGVGRALLSQLFVNLGALRVERVETSVSPENLGLLGFLNDTGFVPSQRIAFVRRFD